MVGKRIKARREELGLTQEQLAQKMGYKSKSSINKIEMEKNDVSQSKLIEFSIALDCSPLYFFQTETTSVNDSLRFERLYAYAEKLANLNKNNLDSALKYIDYLAVNQKGES